ncbi:hypothetical protein OG462_32590 [Streptomyces sp. NBC_01077]|uniref:hypothetical protein n=1 Tax=Streptomyces sp. NBC_01077 TaxID=2903746 RepID=UPI00386878CA|nr:hypothetical protein OG462_32590 [Streptomyces sp. NBC_01077]
MTRSENEVDQIVFRWDSENLTGSTGFGPVAWSGPRDEAENLFRTSGPVLRASGEETRPALIRLQRRSEVMLIRRTPFTDAGGGTSVLCHALVGSPELLEPATCLGLHAWNWQGANMDAAQVRGQLPVIPEEVLVPATGRGQGDLDGALESAAEELSGMVAELLRHQDGRFTVLDERGDTAAPVLWGLHSMFGELTGRRWTFATHDTAELAALRFVFVGRWSGAASGNADRRRVDPRERSGDRAEEVAARLVRHHLRGVAEGEGGEYAVGSALHGASSVRGASLLETAMRALDVLDRRRTGGHAPPRGATGQASWPPDPEEPRTPATSVPEARRTSGRKWGWGLGGRTTEDAPPAAGDSTADRSGRRDATPAGGEPWGVGRPGPYESPEDWFRPDPAEPGVPRDRPTTRADRQPGPPQPAPETDPYRRASADQQPAPPRPFHPAPGSDPYGPDPSDPPHRPARQSRTTLPDPQAPPTRSDHVGPQTDPYGRGARDPQSRPDRSDPVDVQTDPYGRGARDPQSRPARPDPVPPQTDPYGRDAADREPRPDHPDPVATPPSLDKPPPAVPPHRPDLSKAPSQGPGADPYPRPVLPHAEPAWTGPAAAPGRTWAKVRGRAREREAETGLLHKLPAARTVDEARELVERGGNRELLDSLRRPQAYVVLTLLLREAARRLPSWEHPLRRELCEVAIGREFWAVAPPGADADPSDPPEEQRAANAAELHRWAVRPVLAGGDAPVGTVAELLARLRTSPAPSARETFWLIVDGERPGLPEAIWLTLLKEAYGVPRTAPRPGAPAPGAAAGHPDDPGNGYTRRFLRNAALLIGGLVVAILLVVVREWLT